MSDLVEKARELAHRAHEGQVDKAGRPYIEHVSRVAAAVAGNEDAAAVAWLHDVLEDCPGYAAELESFPAHIRRNVIALTRVEGESEASYYAEIASRGLARLVKLADIADNASEDRLALLDERTADRLRKKYARAREALTFGQGQDGANHV